MVFVIAFAVAVQLVNIVLGLAAANALALHLALHTPVIGGIHIHGQHVGLIPQNKVRRAAHADIAFLVQQLPQHLGLVVEQVFIADKVAAFRRDGAAVIHPFRNPVQHGFAGVLIGAGKQFLADAAVL